jgi:hypothetical protein
MTPVETFMATQTEVLRQILQTQQQIAQQMQYRPPMGANHDGPQLVTTYSQFIAMKPPTFTKAEEPLDADAWVRAIEAKFSAFVLPCFEEHKASFVALQLRGEALMLWEHFKTMQPAGHEITWAEFKRVFKDHHIPKGLMVRKMKELLALKQGDNRCMSMHRSLTAFASMENITWTLMPKRWNTSVMVLRVNCMKG